jgi:hypothetical protein
MQKNDQFLTLRNLLLSNSGNLSKYITNYGLGSHFFKTIKSCDNKKGLLR